MHPVKITRSKALSFQPNQNLPSLTCSLRELELVLNGEVKNFRMRSCCKSNNCFFKHKNEVENKEKDFQYDNFSMLVTEHNEVLIYNYTPEIKERLNLFLSGYPFIIDGKLTKNLTITNNKTETQFYWIEVFTREMEILLNSKK